MTVIFTGQIRDPVSREYVDGTLRFSSSSKFNTFLKGMGYSKGSTKGTVLSETGHIIGTWVTK